MMSGMVSFFVIQPKKISINEKRDLAKMPTLDWNGYVTGKWSDSVDLYVNDHFPFRQKFVEFSSVINYARGIHFKHQTKIFVASRQKKHLRNKKDEAALRDTSLNLLDDFEEAYSGDMLIIDGSVYPMNGGSPKMGKVFAKMINEYAEILKGRTRVFSVVAPLSSAFIPVEKYRHYNGKNRATLHAIRDHTSKDAFFSDVFTEMNNHSNEKMFFSTDHHWNARGAYYGYVAFCNSAGFVPVPREKMDKKVKYNFLGSLYELTRDKTVREHADTFEYYIPKISTTAIRYGASGYNGSKSKVFNHGSSGGASYSTFLCGDIPLIKITTNVKNGKKAAIVKNSMGNAFSVFLISHYEEIYVIDFRYSKHNLMDIIKTNKINDLIFAVGMYASMSSGTIGMMRRLATQKDGGQLPTPTPSIDSSAVIIESPTIKDSIK